MAELTRIDPALDILAPHAHECCGCGQPILDRQQWLRVVLKGLPEGRVHTACVIEKGVATIFTEWRNRVTDRLDRKRFGSVAVIVR